MRTLNEIESRFAEIENELKREDITTEEVENLTEEVNQLEEERNELISKAELRQVVLSKVLEVKNQKEEKFEERKEEKKMEERKNILETAEYRSAFLKNLQGKKLTSAEERALTSAEESVGAVVPTITQNTIIEKVFEHPAAAEDL